MAPTNSRPPLTSRIRASFEGKRSKSEVQSPTAANGFVYHDSESLQSAIDQAINSETFQTAIAANLAKIIKPSIKSALDTIQPVVEAVYSHQLLLRKTNQSVEDILIRLDTNAEAAQNARRESMIEDRDVPDSESAVQREAGVGDEGVASAPQQPVAGALSISPDFEQYKQLLEENNAKTAATLKELSSSVDASNSKITDVAKGISDVHTTLGPTKEQVEFLKASSDQSTTMMSVMQAQLDQLKADIGMIINAIGSDLGKNVQAINEKVAPQDTSLLSSHTTKLDSIITDLGALKAHSDTMQKIEAISAELGDLKGSVEAGSSSNTQGFTSLGSQISNVLAAVEGQTGSLAEIRDKGPHPDVLLALQKSNDSHASHAAALNEIKERSQAPNVAPDTSAPQSSTSETTTALQDLKADLAMLKENIEAGLTSNNENVTGLGSKIDTVLTTIEGHKASDPSAEILTAVQKSNESHATHAAALDEIKSRIIDATPVASSGSNTSESKLTSIIATLDAHTSTLDEIKAHNSAHTAALEEVKSLGGAPAAFDTGSLESQIGTLSTTLDEIKTTTSAHSAALEEAKVVGGSSTTVDTSALESQIASLVPVLDAHTAALDEMKAAHGSHTSALHEIKATTGSHSSVLDEIKATGSSHAAALESSRSINDPAADNNTAVHAEITGVAAVLATHTAALEELKALNTSSSVAIVPSTNTDGVEGHLSTIIETLEVQTNLLNELKDDVSAEILTSLHDLIQSNAQQMDTLNEIRETDVSEEILTLLHSSNDSHALTTEALGQVHEGVKALNESHANHGAVLDEIKSRSIGSVPTEAPNLNGLDARVGGIVSILEEHSATLATIKDAAQVSHELHAGHTAALDDIKSKSVEPITVEGSSGGLEAQISGIITTLEEQNITLTAIKEATDASKEFHASHSEVLDEIRDSTAICNESHADHAIALSEIKEISSASTEAHSSHIAALSEIKEGVIASNEAHVSHTAALAELKTARSQQAPSNPESPDIAALESHLNNIITTLESQTSTLSEIKSASSHEDILSDISSLKTLIEESKSGVDEHGALVKDLHSSTEASHTSLKSAIEALAVGGAAGAGTGLLAGHSDEKSTEILEEVKAIHTIVEASSLSIQTTKESVASITSQAEINKTTVTASITTLSDELRSEIDASGTQLHESITALSTNIHGLDIATLKATLQTTSKDVKDIALQVDELDGHVKETGIHFNEEGLGQLKDCMQALDVVQKPVPEGVWFGKRSLPGAPRSVSPETEKTLPHIDDEETTHEPDYAEERDDTHEKVLSPIQEESPPVELVTPKEDKTMEHSGGTAHEPVDHDTPKEEFTKELPEREIEHKEHAHEEEDDVEPEPEPESIGKEEPLADVPEPEIESDAKEHDPVQHEPEAIEKDEPLADEPEPVAAGLDSKEHEPVVEHEPEVIEKEEPLADEPEPVAESDSKEHEPVVEHEPEVIEKEEPLVDEPEPVAGSETKAHESVPEQEVESGETAAPLTDEPKPEVESEKAPHHPEEQDENEKEPSTPAEPELEEDDEDDESASASASTSAIASPLTPSFESGTAPATGKKGKKGKKEKLKKGGKSKKEKVSFELEGEEPGS